jgi:hypothetical protein
MMPLPSNYFRKLDLFLSDPNNSTNAKVTRVCKSIRDIVLSAEPTDYDLINDDLIQSYISCAINCAYNQKYYRGALGDLRALYDSILRNR